MLKGFITAIRTLTILPVPGREAEDMKASLPWFPVVGFILGVILYGLYQLLDQELFWRWPEGIAVVLVIAGILLTRALHLDGLADCADGFWGGRDRESILRIMKDSASGAFGVIAIVVVLLTKWCALTMMISNCRMAWIVTAFIVSRTAMVDLAVTRPYARAEGGTGAPFIDGAKHRHLGTAIIVAILLHQVIFMTAAAWLGALLAGLLISRLIGMFAERKIGGITGDLLGACCEIVETVILVAGAVAGQPEFM